ncbi:nitrate/nitrite transporter [Cohnella fermenti]|uniref:MFS transporter n=1 Tax=Cohnella fermenti TaxID=2565925 RepID=A0A4S4BMN0_9BACL|nr:nitrate/nitrite transporter [Cohnella fermenti]THF76068.1 MFS transporter [Cohnella fermenti]
MRNSGRMQLPLQTLSLVAGFMSWVILSSLLPYIKEDISLTQQQSTWVTAVPVILGSILRIPLGFWTNRFGARWNFAVSFLALLAPVSFISIADSFADLILGGFLLGLSGATFSIGVTSLPKYYPKQKHGVINGIYGMGNVGTAITAFAAPVVADRIGWQSTVQLYLVLLVAVAAANLLLGDKKENRAKVSFKTQIGAVYRNDKLWLLSLFYFITFGSFVAFTVYLPNFLVSNFDLTKADAGLRTAGFIALATLARPIGGWLSDRWNAFIVLMFVFGGLTLSGVFLSFSLSFGQFTVGVLLVALCAGLGNGAVFKMVPLYFSKQGGIVNGIVSAMGGLGGFFPPLVLTALMQMTGHYAIGFMALSEFALVSFVLVIWTFYQEKLRLSSTIIESTIEAILITDANSVIRSVNPAFTAVTGYSPEEVVGKKPSVLKSGRQGKDFYAEMWQSIREKGYWQGEIWNRRKNGEVYLEWLNITAIRNDAGEVKYYAGMFSDISKASHAAMKSG